MNKPFLFISHKHSDAKIAKCIAEFVKDKTFSKVDVHLSSDPDFQGPKLGKNLNEELRNALRKTNALILVYTTDDQDWSYCMWECGVATDPENPHTNILVFQCGRDAPSPFTDVLRVNVRQVDDLRKFTDLFFRDPEFFPGRDQAIEPDCTQQQTNKLAVEFAEKLTKVLPPLEPDEEWSAWPHMCVELPRDEIECLRQGEVTKSLEVALQVVHDHAVVRSTERVPQLFGMASFPNNLQLSKLLQKWKNSFPETDPAWFESCCEQILMSLRRELPIIRLVSLTEVGRETQFVPVVSSVRDLPSKGKTQFDIHFYNLTDPRAIPVTSKMLQKGAFFSKNLGETPPEDIKLMDLLGELTKLARNRLPLLNEHGHPMYIIHRSMIDQFIVRALSGGGKESIDELSLAHLLHDPLMKKMFESTFAVVSKRATLADASNAMRMISDCRDVFVTDGGSANEPVIGWLTNLRFVDIR